MSVKLPSDPQLAANRSIKFAVEVVDKQGDNSSFFVIKGSKEGVDACLYSCLSFGFSNYLALKGRITYLPSFSGPILAPCLANLCTLSALQQCTFKRTLLLNLKPCRVAVFVFLRGS